MRRLLSTTMALGLVITAMNFTGIFAVFTDRATTGTNSVESGPQARIAELQIATGQTGDCSDGTFTDSLVTGLFSVSDLQSGDGAVGTPACLRNAGTAGLTITINAIEVVETEVDCTGDEEAAGDATCGTAGIGDGELAAVLYAGIARVDCATSDIESAQSPSLASVAASPVSLGTLAPGQTMCLWLSVGMMAGGVNGVTLEDVQQAQSDKVEWVYAFDATAS